MKKYTIYLIWITAIGLIAMVLFSCSASKLMRKAIKKGAIVQPKTEYVTTTDTIRINGKDSIITVRVPVTCPEIQIPTTRQEIRYKYRLDKKALQVMKSMYQDSLNTLRKMNKSDKKAETKQVKSNDKKSKVKVWNWFLAGVFTSFFISGLLMLLLTRLFWNK